MYRSRGHRSDRDEQGTRTIWIESLPSYVDEEHLRQQLGGHGIVRYKVNTRANSAAGDKYAFLEFDTQESAAQFMSTYNNSTLPGVQGVVKLDYAVQNSRERRGGGGGNYGGGGGYSGAGGGYGGGRSNLHEDPAIFVGELSDDVTESVLMSAFGQYFPSVHSAKIVRNAHTGQSRGFGFVRFGDVIDRERALQTMQGFLISNRPIRVRSATGRNEPPPKEAHRSERSAGAENPNVGTLFVGNVAPGVTEQMLRQVFEAYGPIIYARVPPGKNCGFVQMADRACAEAALAHAHGQIVGGSAIRVDWGKNNFVGSSGSTPPHASYQQGVYPDYNYQQYDQTHAVDGSAWNASSYPSYSQTYSEQTTPTSIEGIGRWHDALAAQAAFVLQEKNQGELSTAGRNAAFLLSNQNSLLGPSLRVSPV